jgi:prepilin-type processing-associated H-X9-DG protein/prepilin-type N-terminal cleavage/methylation domain-containing protein
VLLALLTNNRQREKGNSMNTKFVTRILKPVTGFTLIELLVVVAIIAVLIAILLPSLGRARDVARTVKCSSALKQMGFAGITYADNENGWWVPIALMTPNYNPTSIVWCANRAFLRNFVGRDIKSKKTETNPLYGAERNNVPKDIICPEAVRAQTIASAYQGGDMSTSDPNDAALWLTYGQNHSGFLNSGVNVWTATSTVAYRVAKIVDPSTAYAFLDAVDWQVVYSSAKADSYYWVYGDTYTPGTTAYRHNGKQSANILFFDGHVENSNWKKVYTNTRGWNVYGCIPPVFNW